MTEDLTDLPEAEVCEFVDMRTILKDEVYAEFRCQRMGIHSFPERREPLNPGDPGSPEVAVFEPCVVCGTPPKYRELSISLETGTQKSAKGGLQRMLTAIVDPGR